MQHISPALSKQGEHFPKQDCSFPVNCIKYKIDSSSGNSLINAAVLLWVLMYSSCLDPSLSWSTLWPIVCSILQHHADGLENRELDHPGGIQGKARSQPP